MSNMTATIYTIDSIGESDVAKKFLGILEKNQLFPQKK